MGTGKVIRGPGKPQQGVTLGSAGGGGQVHPEDPF